MTSSARSIFIFGLYLIGLGLVLLTIPNLLLGIFAMPSTTEVWIRVVGMLVGFLGVYYLLVARANLTAFFPWTIYIRLSVMVFFASFVALGYAPPALILFGVVDALGAGWTRWALRAEKGS